MALSVGTRLGSYEVIALIGVGGMGEVYRARDTKLGRDVALKILPATFVDDPDRVARFQREAQILAALNHPHIAAIYGLEESNGIRALVMELVEGETLAERLSDVGRVLSDPPRRTAGSGAPGLLLEETFSIAHQVAEALEAAHELGIVHRDLKPANIKVRPDGMVKVLDFGLAKLTEPGGAGGVSDARAAAALTQSPTMTNQAMTGAGVILGTAAYMAPEQARGRTVDKRADIWAFGCVLFELLTGKRPFEGEDLSETLAAVLMREPDWSALPADLPPAIPALLKRCLARDPRKRISDAAAALFVLGDPASLGQRSRATADGPRRSARWQRVALFGAAGLVVAAITGAAVWIATRPAPPRVIRTSITPTGAAALMLVDRDFAFTPDGSRIVYLGNNRTQLFLRALDALEPVPIATGTLLRGPFVAPDGQWVGFQENNSTLKKVAITGGPPITLAQLDGNLFGASWAADDMILFATSNLATGLQRVSVADGTTTILTRPDHARGETDHVWPEVLPGGRAVLFTITAPTGTDAAQIAVRDLRTGVQKILIRGGGDAHYVTSGHLVYTASGTLRAVPFDLSRLEVRGIPVPMVPRLYTAGTAGDFAVASDGTLIYVDALAGAANARTLAWVDRTGREQPIAAPPRAYSFPRLSTDGTRIAVRSADQEADIWIWDLMRETLTRLTLDQAGASTPIWTPDGRRIIFGSTRAGAQNLWWQAADGSGAAERLAQSDSLQTPTSVSPDGRDLVFFGLTPGTARDLMRLPLDGTRRATPILQTRFNEVNGEVSPDGHWLAYESDASRRPEIYVRSFSDAVTGQWQISTGGGVQPVWARSGKELFYLTPDGALMSVAMDVSGGAPRAGTPTKLFQGRYYTNTGTPPRTYDVSPDSQRFLMIKPGAGSDQAAASPTLVVVQHWGEELKRLVPTR